MSDFSADGSGRYSSGPGVEPFYHEKRRAVYYAEQRGRLGNALVRIYDEAGNVEREIMPAAEDRMLYRGNRLHS